ncbi:hypothetical protein F183_A20420 [Bryobacterales bacterium F-183]|nr:hypothetical protein F183_A20420 [Bryobacterales bacterium F-183]
MSFLLEVYVQSSQLESALETLAILPFEVNPNLRPGAERTAIEFFAAEADHAQVVQNALTGAGLREPKVNVYEVALI